MTVVQGVQVEFSMHKTERQGAGPLYNRGSCNMDLRRKHASLKQGSASCGQLRGRDSPSLADVSVLSGPDRSVLTTNRLHHLTTRPVRAFSSGGPPARGHKHHNGSQTTIDNSQPTEPGSHLHMSSMPLNAPAECPRHDDTETHAVRSRCSNFPHTHRP